MNIFKNLLLGILFAIMFASLVRAQYEHLTCGLYDQLPEGELQAVIGGKYKPSANAPGEYLRVVFVFVQFASDSNYVPGWEKDSLPD